MQRQDGDRAPGLWQTILSVLAAFSGIQSNRNRERDFTHGNPVLFILVGVALTILLVLGIYIAVQIILARAGV